MYYYELFVGACFWVGFFVIAKVILEFVFDKIRELIFHLKKTTKKELLTDSLIIILTPLIFASIIYWVA